MRRIRDGSGRAVEIGEWGPNDWEGLLALYGSVDPAQQKNDLPPLGEERRAVWVEQLLGKGPSVVARSGGRVVGHAALVTDPDTAAYQPVVFVRPEYQGSGVENALLDAGYRVLRRQAGRASLADRWARVVAAIVLGLRVRLRGVGDAVRFARIPAACALVVAAVSQDPHGRVLALGLAVAMLCMGLGVHAREIFLGHPSARRGVHRFPAEPGERTVTVR